MTINLDMYMTAALGLIMLLIGQMIRKKVYFFEKFCIPAPVIGGTLFAILNLVLHMTGILNLEFEETLKDFFMMIFFTTVGFQADFTAVRQGGKELLIFIFLITVLIACQNALSLGVSSLMGVSSLLGMCTGSIPMVGGHGTAASFGPILEEMGFAGGTVYATAAATYGLLSGSLMGGPIARHLIRKNNINAEPAEETAEEKKEKKVTLSSAKSYTSAAYQLILAMGIGSIIGKLISMTGFTVPSYIGSMIAAAIITNLATITRKFTLAANEINEIGGISLSLFLGIAMITLKLWQLAELALPLIILLVIQTIFMACFAMFFAFPLLGKDYDAAVMTAGLCGFGMGATPNALANMQSVCYKRRFSEKAFLVVPLAGALFADFINSGVLTVIINMIG